MLIKLNEYKGKLRDAGKRVSNEDIAEATGINLRTIENISSGTLKEFRGEYVDALVAYFARALGVPVADINLVTPEPVTLPLSLNIRPDRHGAKVGERTKGKAPEPVEVTTSTPLHPAGLAPLTAANLRKPLASLIDPGAVAVDTIRMEKLEARRRTLLEQAAKGRV